MQSPSFLEVDMTHTLRRKKAAKAKKSNKSRVLIGGVLLAIVVLGLIASNSYTPSVTHLAEAEKKDEAKKDEAKKDAAKKEGDKKEGDKKEGDKKADDGKKKEDDKKKKCGIGCKIKGFFAGLGSKLKFWKSSNPMISIDVWAYMECNGDTFKENRLVCNKKSRVRKYNIKRGDLIKLNDKVKAFGLISNMLNFDYERNNNLGEESKVKICWLSGEKKDKKIKENDKQKFENCKELTFHKKDIHTDGKGLGSDKHWDSYLILKEDGTFGDLITRAELNKRDKSKEPWGKKEVKAAAAGEAAAKGALKKDDAKKDGDAKKPDDKKAGDAKKPDDKKAGDDKKADAKKPDGDKKDGDDKKPDGDKKDGDDKKPDGDKKDGDDKKPDGDKKKAEENEKAEDAADKADAR